MSSQIEFESTSVDQAVVEAVEHFGVKDSNELDIEIVEEPKSGYFLGLGSKKAKIKAGLKTAESFEEQSQDALASDTLVSDPDDYDLHKSESGSGNSESSNNEACESKLLTDEEKELVCDTVDMFLENISYAFDMDFHREILIKDRNVTVNINGDDVANLIGKRGQTLLAIQHLMGIIVSRALEFRIRLDIDISGYKTRRKSSIQKIAREAAKQVESTGKEISLEPMDAASRKIVHVYLRDFDNVSTLSVGEGERRFVIIVPEEGNKKTRDKKNRPRKRKPRKATKNLSATETGASLGSQAEKVSDFIVSEGKDSQNESINESINN
jgi:spoIIIJ-associated protein